MNLLLKHNKSKKIKNLYIKKKKLILETNFMERSFQKQRIFGITLKIKQKITIEITEEFC